MSWEVISYSICDMIPGVLCREKKDVLCDWHKGKTLLVNIVIGNSNVFSHSDSVHASVVIEKAYLSLD